MGLLHLLPILLCINGFLFNHDVVAAKAGKGQFFEKNKIIRQVPTEQKVIALTFDDGPDYKNTPQILKVLKQYDAKATFFVMGWRVERLPSIVKQELLEGHEIGNHTFSHPEIWNLPENRINKEIKRAQEVIGLAVGKNTSHLFRPVGGYVSEKVVNAAKKAGYTVVLWSWDEDSFDWQKTSADRIVRRVVKNAHNGDIVLFHDHGTQTVQALKAILPQLQKQGFKFVTVSELLNRKGQQEINQIIPMS